MSALLVDRILAELAEDPKTEDDLVVCFPKAGRDVIRVKVTELKRAGKVLDREGVFSIRPGVSVAESVELTTADQALQAVENTRKVQQAISASARQHAPAAAAQVIGRKVCPNCKQSRSIAAFVDAGGTHRAKWCTDCRADPQASRVQASGAAPHDPGPLNPADSKVCAKCETAKPRSEFAKNVAKKDGLQSACKLCSNRAYVAWSRRKTGEGNEPAPAPQQENEPPPAEPVATAPTAAAPAEEPAPLRVLQFPEREKPKTLEDVLKNREASAILQPLQRLVVNDPMTGVQVIVLSDAGLAALRRQLAPAAG